MTTKEIVEAILYLNPSTEKYFKASHIISKERNWKAFAHPEFPFINNFKDPKFIVIISKQIHVYLIGDLIQGKRYNVINIEGFSADHLSITKGVLTDIIKKTVSEKLFLPDNYQDRIIYMHDGELYIFNRLDTKGNIFSKSKWSLGTDIYSADVKTYETNARDILKAIYSEF